MHCPILNTITLRSDGMITCGENVGYDIELAEVSPGKKWKKFRRLLPDLTSGIFVRPSVEDPFLGQAHARVATSLPREMLQSIRSINPSSFELNLHCNVNSGAQVANATRQFEKETKDPGI